VARIPATLGSEALGRDRVENNNAAPTATSPRARPTMAVDDAPVTARELGVDGSATDEATTAFGLGATVDDTPRTFGGAVTDAESTTGAEVAAVVVAGAEVVGGTGVQSARPQCCWAVPMSPGNSSGPCTGPSGEIVCGVAPVTTSN